jgi:hypothetical protein
MGSKPPVARALSAAEQATIRNNAIQGLGEVSGAEHIHVFGSGDGARIVRSADGADLIRDGDELQWVDRHDTNVPRQAWRDDFGPLAGPQALEDFLYHEREFDRVRSGDPVEAEKRILAYGYRSVGQFFRVRMTMHKYHATPTGPNLNECVVSSQAYVDAMMRADQRHLQQQHQATFAANPEILAPIEGITVDQYAAIAARAAQNPPQDQLLALLAQHNLDLAAWNRVSSQWTDRMSKDTTGAIATAYGKAFMGAGQGQFGAAGQAAATAGLGMGGAAGAEPIPYERLCEIQGAMSAWAKTGQDVNASLKSQFNMVAGDWSAASTWWMTQLMADVARFSDYQARVDTYERRYMGARPKADQDIAF